MNVILFADFKLEACDFLKFDWFEKLNSYAKFLIKELSTQLILK